MKRENMSNTHRIENDPLNQSHPQKGGRSTLMRVSRWVLLGLAFVMLMNGGWKKIALFFDSTSSSFPQATTTVEVIESDVKEPSETYEEDKALIAAILESTEEFWQEKFTEEGLTYAAPTLVLYTGSVQTNNCGFESSAVGPFYCPTDQKIYLDLDFYDELTNKNQELGELAIAYVIAHEVGHHVQNLRGTFDTFQNATRNLHQKDANQLNVRLELQADYFAGAWTRFVDDAGYLDMDDMPDALQAAHTVGDDMLQKQTYQRVVPDSFTHGTDKQRESWFNHGFNHADFEHADTFNQSIDLE